jgi:hypothetical protein
MSSRQNLVGGGLLLLAGAVRLPQLGHSLNEAHAFRQTQTAAVARAYAEQGIDLLHTPLPVFGFASDVPMEAPLVQAAGALLIGAGIPSDTAMRALGLLGFIATIALLGVLMRRWHGAPAAGVAMLVAAFSPFGLAWGASSLIEFPATALALVLVLSGDSWLRRGRPIAVVLVALAGVAAFLVKATTAPVWCVLLGFAALAHLREVGWRAGWRRVVVLAGTGPVLGLAAAVAWTTYADGVKASSPLTGFLTSRALAGWNFGSPEQRLDPSAYLLLAQRVTEQIVGPLGIVLLAGVAAALLSGGPARWRSLGWAATAIAGPAVFFNLYVVHSYYLSAVFPALSAVVALGVVGIGSRVRRPVWRAVAGLVTVAAVLAAAATGLGRADLHQWLVGESPPVAAAVVAAAVPADRGVVLIGCDWSPAIPYYAHRVAAMLRTPSAEFWASEDIRRYAAVYECHPGLDPADYLPSGVELEPTGVVGLHRIVTEDAD